MYLYKFLIDFINLINLKINLRLGFGNNKWGLGIGDWAQSPIPNPQSPMKYFFTIIYLL